MVERGSCDCKRLTIFEIRWGGPFLKERFLSESLFLLSPRKCCRHFDHLQNQSHQWSLLRHLCRLGSFLHLSEGLFDRLVPYLSLIHI